MLRYKSLAKKTIKKSISLREDVFLLADAMCDKYFGGNFSAYLTYLICADKHGLSRVVESNEASVEKVKMRENMYSKSDENESYIDEILNM